MKRSLFIVLSMAALLSAAACSATNTPAAPGGGAATAPVTSAAGGAFSAVGVCAYLKGKIPDLKAIGSPVGRHANLAGNLAGFFETHGKPADGAELDAATKAQCPEVRTEVLQLTGVDDFSVF